MRSAPSTAIAVAIAVAAAGVFSAVLTFCPAALAQLSTSTIKGRISSEGSPAQAGLAVTAVNKANGITYRTTTLADGSYVLTGLAPGEYEIRVAGAAARQDETSRCRSAKRPRSIWRSAGSPAAAHHDRQFAAAQGRAHLGARHQRVAQMIESLPQGTHNFLSSADLAPGVQFVQDTSGNTRIQAGAQNFDHVNVFIDGVGQKNNILRGGLTGQDSTRGNPFPQSAIAEYRVLTQNYKAEFDQVSSAAISAVTKSGTNEFHGDAYLDRTGTNWRARTPFEKQNEDAGMPLPPSKKYEYGLSLGGPIKQDRLHYFFAYDGKRIDDSRSVTARNLDLLPAGLGIVPSLAAAQGSSVDEFREHLAFGKVDAQLSDNQRSARPCGCAAKRTAFPKTAT